MSINYASKLTSMAGQVFKVAPDKVHELVMVHSANGALKQVCTPFEMRALPDKDRRHCRMAKFKLEKKAVVLDVPEK